MSSSAAIFGASAAAAAAARMRQEEEEMLAYQPEDMNNWEFKILRANMLGGFRKTEILQKALEEEAQNGWQLVEKFDDMRIRLKRRTTDRNKVGSSIDPYRTIYGMSMNESLGIMFAFIFGLSFLIIIMAMLVA